MKFFSFFFYAMRLNTVILMYIVSVPLFIFIAQLSKRCHMQNICFAAKNYYRVECFSTIFPLHSGYCLINAKMPLPFDFQEKKGKRNYLFLSHDAYLQSMVHRLQQNLLAFIIVWPEFYAISVSEKEEEGEIMQAVSSKGQVLRAFLHLSVIDFPFSLRVWRQLRIKSVEICWKYFRNFFIHLNDYMFSFPESNSVEIFANFEYGWMYLPDLFRIEFLHFREHFLREWNRTSIVLKFIFYSWSWKKESQEGQRFIHRKMSFPIWQKYSYCLENKSKKSCKKKKA